MKIARLVWTAVSFLLLLLLVGLLMLIAADRGGTPSQAASSQHTVSRAEPTGPAGAHIYAGVKHIVAGRKAVLSRVPRFGELTARCLAHGRIRTRFTADRWLATADVVVTTSRGQARSATVQPKRGVAAPLSRPAVTQTWTIAEFSEADVRPTVITVGAREDRGSFYSCAAMAQAVVGAPGPGG